MSSSGVILIVLVCFIFTGEIDSSGQSCGECIDNTSCNTTIGECPHGCKSNFKPPACKECIVGFWGQSCEKTCGSCKGRSSCDKQNGKCPTGCESGKQPSLCTEDCNTGTFGPGCKQNCSQHCKWVGVTHCDPSIGTCRECKVGYTGELCKTQCPRGTSGKKCADRCSNCFGDNCHHETGECRQGCVAGFQGDRCQVGCSNNTYGMNCNATCDCLGNPCNTVTGMCQMTPDMFAEKHNFWFTYKGGIVGSAIVVLLILLIIIIICVIKSRRRKTKSLLQMHRIQKKLSDNVNLTGVNPESELGLQSELQSRFTQNKDGESSEPYSQFSKSDSRRYNQDCGTGTAPDTSRDQVTSITSVSSNYVTALASPDQTETPYVNLNIENRATVNPYESHKFFQTRNREDDAAIYANSGVRIPRESEL